MIYACFTAILALSSALFAGHNSENCSCTNCSCTEMNHCGCYTAPESPAASACQCGADCQCGPECQCEKGGSSCSKQTYGKRDT